MNFQTPEWVCEIMVSMIDGDPSFVLEPTSGEGNLVRAIQKKFPDCTITEPNNIFQYEPEQKFDCIVANPPFTPMVKGYEILQRIIKWSDDIVILLPWLLLINSERRSKWFVENGLSEVRHLPRRAFPGSRVQTCIVKMIKDYDGYIMLNF